MAREKRMRTIERNDESELDQKLLTPASRDSGIKVLGYLQFLKNAKYV